MTNKEIETGGGTFVGKDINIDKGDFVGRDKTNAGGNTPEVSSIVG